MNRLLLNLICWTLLLSSCSQKTEMDTPTETLPTITIDPISIVEGNNSIQPIYLNVRLSSSSQKTIRVTLNSKDGSALAGEDFNAVSNEEIVFSPGDVQYSFRIDIIGDEVAESDESFFIQASNVENAILGTSEVEITIQTDEQDNQINIPTTGFVSPMEYPGMQLIWQDEFNNNQDLNQNWNFEIGTGNSGWGNNELQFYRKENVSIYENHLVIEAKEENYNGRNYTSTRMITKGKFDFKYGRVDIRANLPFGQGIWPALWMLGDNISTVGWPKCGEIDIMEIVGHEANKLHGTAHWSNLSQNHEFMGGSTTLPSGIFNDQFYVFSVIWNAEKIEWLLNDEPYFELNITSSEFSEFQNNFFFIFNVAVGGNWPGSPDASTTFPQRMIVDYIRVFQ